MAGLVLGVALAAGVLLTAGDVTPARGHGPCGCLEPRLAQAGSPVRVGGGLPAYRVILNPRPRDLGIAPSYLASAYRADAATTTVLSRRRDRPTDRARFRLPAATPPGMYLVLIYDGEEGGAHNTWEYLHVIDPDRPPAQAPRSTSSASPLDRWALLAGVALGALVTGAALGWRRRT